MIRDWSHSKYRRFTATWTEEWVWWPKNWVSAFVFRFWSCTFAVLCHIFREQLALFRDVNYGEKFNKANVFCNINYKKIFIKDYFSIHDANKIINKTQDFQFGAITGHLISTVKQIAVNANMRSSCWLICLVIDKRLETSHSG